MPKRRPLSDLRQDLINAREAMGLSLADAARLMPNTTYHALWFLEGGDESRTPPGTRGYRIALQTAVDIAIAYWPQIMISDLLPGDARLFFSINPPELEPEE